MFQIRQVRHRIMLIFHGGSGHLQAKGMLRDIQIHGRLAVCRFHMFQIRQVSNWSCDLHWLAFGS
jgi:hypothetical protein